MRSRIWETKMNDLEHCLEVVSRSCQPAVHSTLNILETVRGRGLVPKDHQYIMAYGLPNGHVTDDVTWPWKVRFVTPIRLRVQYLENGCFNCAWQLTSHSLPPSCRSPVLPHFSHPFAKLTVDQSKICTTQFSLIFSRPDRTNGRAYATVLRLSSVCDVMYCG